MTRAVIHGAVLASLLWGCGAGLCGCGSSSGARGGTTSGREPAEPGIGRSVDVGDAGIAGGTIDVARGSDVADTSVGRAAKPPVVRVGASPTRSLSKTYIRDSIRGKLPQIKLCYEAGLLVDPTLAGRVQTEFVIGLDGQVVSAEAAGVNDEVAACVADAVRSIRFPAPSGGGVVSVRYPFVFKPAGAPSSPPRSGPSQGMIDAGS